MSSQTTNYCRRPAAAPAPIAPLGARAARVLLRAWCRRPRLVRGACGAGLAIASGALAADLDLSKLPPPAAMQVEFDRDVKPIFESRCFRCHGTERPKSGFSLATREAALRGGHESAEDIVPGDSARSRLIHYAARLVEGMEMPPEGKGDPLTSDEVALLRAWIDQGAAWSKEPAAPSREVSFATTGRWITVSGNERKFREHEWRREGWGGGLERAEWQERFGENGRITAEAHALAPEANYGLKVLVEKPDLGFWRVGYQQFRHYFDDTGGFYAPFGEPLQLGRDLHLDTGRAWVDLGLTLPDWPRMTLGYEYEFREGDRSTLQWGTVYDAAGQSRNVFPAFKQVEERTHLLKFDLSHTIAGVGIEDSFRGEFYDLATSRPNVESFGLGNAAPDFLTRYDEHYRHFQGANTLRLETQLRDWLLLSGGYLYSRLSGEASFNAQSFFPSDPTLGPFEGDAADELILRRESHVFNANAQLGPWRGLVVAAGVQSEWTRQEGFGDALVFGLPARLGANLDRATVEESFGVRYTAIPYTVLYAEGRFVQESIGQFEEQAPGDPPGAPPDFLRDTDATGDLKEARAGLTLSPWTWLSWQASYRHRVRADDFDHRRDLDEGVFGVPGDGYSAFILARDVTSDQVETKLVLRPASWLKTSLSYRIVATDFDTVTEAVEVSSAGTPLAGGRLFAGNYDAHVYGVSATLTPWRRLYWTTSFSVSQTRLVTGVNNGAEVVPFNGDVFNVLSTANYVLSTSTDLHATYSFSRADYGQANEAAGLPLGIEYDRHGVLTGFTRRFKHKLAATLQYGFFRYDEPTAGRAADYTAHAVFATLRKSGI